MWRRDLTNPGLTAGLVAPTDEPDMLIIPTRRSVEGGPHDRDFSTGSLQNPCLPDLPVAVDRRRARPKRDGRPSARTTAPDRGLRPGPAGTPVVLAVPTASVGKPVASQDTAPLPAAGGYFASAEWPASSCILHEGQELGAPRVVGADGRHVEVPRLRAPNPTHRVPDSRRSPYRYV